METSVQRVLRIWLSCTIVPFMAITEQMFIMEPGFKKMKRCMAIPDVFDDYAAMISQQFLFDDPEEKLTYSEFQE